MSDETHLTLAARYAAQVEEATGLPLIYALGAFYQYDKDSRLWKANSQDAIAADIGRCLSGPLCRRNSDYRQIAQLVATRAAFDDFFTEAPAGIAAGKKFYLVQTDGKIVCEALGPNHRQRMSVPAVPDFNAEPPLLSNLLDNALGKGEPGRAQRELLQMSLGAALTGMLWRYRTVLMLFGASSTGKSTLLDVLKRFFPADRVGATNPQNWSNEYHSAALAGKSLNMVGELDGSSPLLGGIFKAVTGGDVIEARHPSHRPFSFVCQASHIFNCNRMPPTRDKSDAFFRRWRIIEFQNSIVVGREIIGLADRIFNEEQAAVLAWLLTGAANLSKAGALPETENHKRLVEYWRAANNSAVQFLLDRQYVDLKNDPAAPVAAQEVFQAYRNWAREAGLKQLGRNSFYEAIQDGGARHGVAIDDDKDGVKKISGMGLLKCL